MQVSLDGSMVGLVGVLNEHVDLHSVEAAIMTAHQMASDEQGVVFLDLSKVQRANSSGLLQWLRMTKRLKVPLCYVNVPVWLVEQFNMIDEFFDGQVQVESIFAHFYSPDTDSSESRLLKIGTDVPVLEHYRNFHATATSSEGKQLEPDFDERSYFHFIARHIYKKAAP